MIFFITLYLIIGAITAVADVIEAYTFDYISLEELKTVDGIVATFLTLVTIVLVWPYAMYHDYKAMEEFRNA